MFNGLKQRGARWFLRRRVPAQYIEAWGSAEVTRALGTSDYRVARRLLPRVTDRRGCAHGSCALARHIGAQSRASTWVSGRAVSESFPVHDGIKSKDL
ncbi:DUF6538 domain-containing protein [Phenylobacterium sp.]|uniref:DUF6538 domain-containing protein n=1 Tax=Phenylobacterium sp. TaxID=1871053 RepID=UPI0034365C45